MPPALWDAFAVVGVVSVTGCALMASIIVGWFCTDRWNSWRCRRQGPVHRRQTKAGSSDLIAGERARQRRKAGAPRRMRMTDGPVLSLHDSAEIMRQVGL